MVATKILSPEKLDEAVSLLREGIPVAFPTETVYGLGASAFNPQAVKRIFSMKGRPPDNPLIVHIALLDQAGDLASFLPKSFFQLAERFWPGPLSLVVPRSPRVPAIVSGGLETVGIRMPVHGVARRLIEHFGEPLAAPSANLSGRPSPTSAADVLEDLGGVVPLIIDGGKSAIGIESTVLRLGDSPMLLRPGKISREELEEALHCQIALPTEKTEAASPGMKYPHYAPRAKVTLVFDLQEAKGDYVITRVTERNLFAKLREADHLGMKEVCVVCDSAMRAREGLMDRILRAAGQ